jgi:hypothetical protein
MPPRVTLHAEATPGWVKACQWGDYGLLRLGGAGGARELLEYGILGMWN